MSARPLRLGTRASTLAVTQSTLVADALRALGADVELVMIRTAGDQRAPDTAWGEGAFVGALEAALLENRIDLAVHSAKDVPTKEDARLRIAAYPTRADPRDALVCRDRGGSLAALPHGARVGTDSQRRTAFLLARRPDLRMHPLHGNVDTRLARLDAGDTDALILAVSGLIRLGRTDRIGEILDATVVPPAPGQGSLAVQVRADDATTTAWVGRLDDPASRMTVEAERAFLRASGGGCRAPIGALARIDGEQLVLVGAAAGAPGTDRSTACGEIATRVAGGTETAPGAERRAAAGRLAVRLRAELAGGAAPAELAGGAAPAEPATGAPILVEATTR